MYAESWQILSIAISFLAAVVQIAGLVTPLWIWMDADSEHLGIGIFYRVGYESDGVVQAHAAFAKVKYDSDQTIDTKHWTAMAALEVVSTVNAVLLFPILIHFSRMASISNPMYWTFRCALWVSIFAWLSNLVGLVVFIIYHGDILTEGPEISDESFSWGGLICACGLLLHVALTLIIYQCIWPDEDNAIPAAADPKMAMFSSTTNANINQFYQAYYNQNANRPAIEDVTPPDTRAVQDRRLSIMPAPRDIPERPSYMPERPSYPPPMRAPRSPPPMPRRLSTEVQRIDSLYGNMPQDFQNVNGQAGFDNQGFAHSSPLGRQRDVQRHIKTTILDRDSKLDTLYRGGEEEVVFNKVYQPNDERRRSSLYKELENITTARKKSADFLVTAKHSVERDVHRDNTRYLSHTNRPSDQDNQAQRLVLSPSNFTESNVKYNPTYIYRPYSETVY